MVVVKSPISFTVPVTSPALIKSPTLKGFKKTRNTPAARLDIMPPHMASMAKPTPAKRPAMVVVWNPK
jgi:hypothetical protein